MKEKLTQQEETVLDYLKEGEAKPSVIAELSGMWAQNVSTSLRRLMEKGLVLKQGRGIWVLSAKGKRA